MSETLSHNLISNHMQPQDIVNPLEVMNDKMKVTLDNGWFYIDLDGCPTDTTPHQAEVKIQNQVSEGHRDGGFVKEILDQNINIIDPKRNWRIDAVINQLSLDNRHIDISSLTYDYNNDGIKDWTAGTTLTDAGSIGLYLMDHSVYPNTPNSGGHVLHSGDIKYDTQDVNLVKEYLQWPKELVDNVWWTLDQQVPNK